jgi:hypothetical protein
MNSKDIADLASVNSEFKVKHLAKLQAGEQNRFDAFKAKRFGSSKTATSDRAAKGFLDQQDPTKTRWQRSRLGRSSLTGKDRLLMQGAKLHVGHESDKAADNADQFSVRREVAEINKIDADLDAATKPAGKEQADAFKAGQDAYIKALQDATNQNNAELEKARELSLLEEKVREKDAQNAKEEDKAKKEQDLKKAKERTEKINKDREKSSLYQSYLDVQYEINSIRNMSHLDRGQQDQLISSKGLDVKAAAAKKVYEDA